MLPEREMVPEDGFSSRVCRVLLVSTGWSKLLALAVVVVVKKGTVLACFCASWPGSVSQVFSLK